MYTHINEREYFSNTSKIKNLFISHPDIKHDSIIYDDFIVGDRVWVDGNKPGVIQYIGEVHFAEGDWAGVVLDEPVGRNAGSVSGRRYFYCEPKRGLFCRLHRLARYCGKHSPDSGISEPIRRLRNISLSDRSSPSRSPTRFGSEYRSRSRFSLHDKSPIRYRSLSPEDIDRDAHFCKVHDTLPSYRMPRRPARTITTVSTKTTTIDGPYKPGPLRLGDKVFVNTHKGVVPGRLRYLGMVHFAPGQWAGIELDEPAGKHDGQVAGKR